MIKYGESCEAKIPDTCRKRNLGRNLGDDLAAWCLGRPSQTDTDQGSDQRRHMIAQFDPLT